MGAARGDGRTHGETPAVLATGLRRCYGQVVAVDAMDFEVRAGSVVGFLGPNGAGKTTVIRILSTLLPPDAGSFVVAGVPDSRPTEIRRLIGVLPESAGYPQGQTGEEWLVFHGQLFGLDRHEARARAARLLDEVGLADSGRALVAAYSRGMRQRLGIARALVNDPAVVFLDEPTLGLDPQGQAHVLELVTRVAREHGVAVLISTHLLDEVEQVCDRVMVLNHGRLVVEGTVEEVVARAAAPREATLQVPPAQRGRALEVLQAANGVVAREGRRPSAIELELPAGMAPQTATAAVLRELLAQDLPVLGLTLAGGRLSDAFLALTANAP